MPTENNIKEYINYDPITGKLSWKKSYREKVVGQLIRNTVKGYIRFHFMNKALMGHRVAWLLQTGKWPVNVIDHINGERDDNRWINLRDVTIKENFQSFRRISPRNKTGYTGVSWNAKKNYFTATKTVDGKAKFLGCFDTAEDANQAYINADKLDPANPRKYRERRGMSTNIICQLKFLPNGETNPDYGKLWQIRQPPLPCSPC